jgi:hypothetical protein
VLRQVTVFIGVALETSVLPCDVIAACGAAALGAVLLGTARRGANTASLTAAQRVFGRELFTGRCLETPLRNPTNECCSFFRFGGGRPLHKVYFFLLRKPPEVPTPCSMIFSRKVSHMSFLRVPPLPRGARSPEFHPWTSFMVGSFIPVLHCGPFRRLFPSVRLFRVSRSASLFCLLRLCPAQRVIFIPAAVTSFRSPQFLCVQNFLKMFLLRHATVARRDTFLQAAANFSRDLQIPRFSPFGSSRRPAACFRHLRCFLSPSTGITVASSLGTS